MWCDGYHERWILLTVCFLCEIDYKQFVYLFLSWPLTEQFYSANIKKIPPLASCGPVKKNHTRLICRQVFPWNEEFIDKLHLTNNPYVLCCPLIKQEGELEFKVLCSQVLTIRWMQFINSAYINWRCSLGRRKIASVKKKKKSKTLSKHQFACQHFFCRYKKKQQLKKIYIYFLQM